MTMNDGSMRRDHEDGDDDAGDETTMRMMSDEDEGAASDQMDGWMDGCA